MSGKEIRVDHKVLKGFVKEVHAKLGFTEKDAETGADMLIWANLRGVDSHGVLRLPWFVKLVESGDMRPHPAIKVLKETPAVWFIDADRSLGAISAKMAMEKAIEKAGKVGIGWSLVSNTITPLAIGYYTLMAAAQDMVGMAITCGMPNMAPYGAKVAGLQNCPCSVAVPALTRRPLVLDMATSIAAKGKIDYAIDKGVEIPHGWALDKNGNPTTDPRKADIMLPMGGYKGSDQSMVFECLSGIMAAHPLVAPVLLGAEQFMRHRQNSVMAAVDIATFSDPKEYRQRVDDLIRGIKGLTKAEGFAEILVPGEPEDRMFEERSRTGIPLPEGTVKNLRDVASKLGMKLPAFLAS